MRCSGGVAGWPGRRNGIDLRREADELELLDKSVRHAADAADADDALEAIGWSDVLAAEPRDAVSVVFGALGDLNAVASALDDVMLDALGRLLGARRCARTPGVRRLGAPGTLHDGRLALDGLALGRVTRRETVAVPTATATASSSRSCAPTRSNARAIDGLSPELGLSRLPTDGAQPVTTETLEPAAWDDALIAGRRALADGARGRRARDAAPRTRARARARAVRSTHRPVPGRPPPAGRNLRRARSGRRRGRVGVGRTRSADRHAGQVPRRAGRHRRGQALPAGARRHRVHRRPRAASLHQARAGARRPARIVEPSAAELGTTLLATRQLPRLLDL